MFCKEKSFPDSTYGPILSGMRPFPRQRRADRLTSTRLSMIIVIRIINFVLSFKDTSDFPVIAVLAAEAMTRRVTASPSTAGRFSKFLQLGHH